MSAITTAPAGKEIATLAGGCFWCLEAVYDELKGVESVESGYMGGETPNPGYEQVCGGKTGHAEVVQITFDPKAASFRELLDVFFVIHDPTTLNRQGNDSGTQYRSGIYYTTPEQKEEADGDEHHHRQQRGENGLVQWARRISSLPARRRSCGISPPSAPPRRRSTPAPDCARNIPGGSSRRCKSAVPAQAP